jgi:hypothetical protein
MRGRLFLLALTLGLAGCGRADRAGDTAPATSVSPATPPAETARAPSAPMPRAYRRRLEDAVERNRECESCHVKQATEWRESRHRQSDTNAAYRAAFAIEPTAFCRGCHAPESDPDKDPPQAVSDMGVGCVTCHVTEEGSVLTAPSPRENAVDAPHPLRRSIEFGRSGACAGCHEFRFPGARDDDDAAFMQTTVREHERSANADKACTVCHMRSAFGGRSHAFAEVRDPMWLRDKLHATVARAGDTLRITLAQRLPGHGFPTGDLFRRLEIGCEVRDERGNVVHREARHLARHFEIVPGKPMRQLTGDDRVFDEPTIVDLPISSKSGILTWWVKLQRVATVGIGTSPAEAKIESEVLLHSGVIPWKMR